MFKFIRQISRNHTEPETSTRFWILVLGEFVLVVLGLFLALQIENWNQNRQDRKLEQILLRDMKNSLTIDLRDANWNYRYLDGFKRSNEVVLSYLDGEIPYHDSLKYHFVNRIA